MRCGAAQGLPFQESLVGEGAIRPLSGPEIDESATQSLRTRYSLQSSDRIDGEPTQVHGSGGYIVEEHPLGITLAVMVLLLAFWLARRR